MQSLFSSVWAKKKLNYGLVKAHLYSTENTEMDRAFSSIIMRVTGERTVMDQTM